MNDQEIETIKDKAIQDKKNIVIEIYGGCFNGIHNLPDGYTYTLIDWDNLKEEDQETYNHHYNNQED